MERSTEGMRDGQDSCGCGSAVRAYEAPQLAVLGAVGTLTQGHGPHDHPLPPPWSHHMGISG